MDRIINDFNPHRQIEIQLNEDFAIFIPREVYNAHTILNPGDPNPFSQFDDFAHAITEPTERLTPITFFNSTGNLNFVVSLVDSSINYLFFHTNPVNEDAIYIGDNMLFGRISHTNLRRTNASQTPHIALTQPPSQADAEPIIEDPEPLQEILSLHPDHLPNPELLPPPPPVADAATHNEIVDLTMQTQQTIQTQTTPQSSAKKRKRLKENTPIKEELKPIEDDDDDGYTCPICLDAWEMSGAHRLMSLKCGHLFGHSCIKRWLQECPPNGKTCPSCKSRATVKDIRFIYAKKICVVDKSDEYRLQAIIDEERKKVSQLQFTVGILKTDLEIQKKLCSNMERELESARKQTEHLEAVIAPTFNSYKLSMEKNVEVSKEPGCRVMVYGRNSRCLIVSQKSTQSLFPGFGVRFIDIPTFRPAQFLHMSSKQVRDLSMDAEEEHLIAASLTKSAKLFNINNRACVAEFQPSADKLLWAAAFDRKRTNFLYLGTQQGSTYLYDTRNPQTFVDEFRTEGDMSPVVNIASIPPGTDFPNGGFLVCKLQSIWFYEYTSTISTVPSKLFIDGPFVSMTYDENTNYVLISTRPSSKIATSRYIVSNLRKIDDHIILQEVTTLYGSKSQSVMSRCAQFKVDDNVIVAAYMQDTKLLTTWGVMNNTKMQSLSITDTILDVCPIYVNNQIYLSALSDCRCRIFKVNKVLGGHSSSSRLLY